MMARASTFMPDTISLSSTLQSIADVNAKSSLHRPPLPQNAFARAEIQDPEPEPGGAP
jgi:hypothetical protein